MATGLGSEARLPRLKPDCLTSLGAQVLLHLCVPFLICSISMKMEQVNAFIAFRIRPNTYFYFEKLCVLSSPEKVRKALLESEDTI